MNGNTSADDLFDNTVSLSSTPISLSNNTGSGDPTRLKQARQLLTLLTQAERAVQRDPYVAATYLNQAIDLVVVEDQSGPAPLRNRGGLPRWQIARVNDYIKEHLDHSIRATELAAVLGLSVSHFSQAFKQTTGLTPVTYVTAARIEAARQFMLSSGQPLSVVALTHGFCDQSHFCRVFKRETGLSPQTWRKLYQNGSRI